MEDKELEALKKRKLMELKRRLTVKEKRKDEVDDYQILNKAFKGKAWEVFNAAKNQFPEATERIKEILVKLFLSGRLIQINGIQLYALLRNIGLSVRLNTEIRYLGRGEVKSIAEKLKEASTSATKEALKTD